MKILITGGRVVDPSRQLDSVTDIAIASGVFVDPAKVKDDPLTEIIDATGLVVMPGLVDMHTHLREPGPVYKEDIASGTRCAAAGGFTTIVAMPNTLPPLDSEAVLRDFEARVAEHALVNVLACACITKGRAGRELADLAGYRRFPFVVAVSDDGDCVQDDALMRQAAEQCAKLGLVLVDHCEDRKVMCGGVVRAGEVADLLKVQGMPPETESNMVARGIELARRYGVHFHVAHMSTARSVEMVAAAQAEKLNVTAEVTPHHLVLTNDILPVVGASAKMNPPLGVDDDRLALRDALARGVVRIIATDHAPHAPFEKVRNLTEAPFGILGLETALPLCHTELVCSGVLDLSTLVACFTTGPCQLLGLEAGTLRPGAAADLCLFDPAARSHVDIRLSLSKSRNSPFHNHPVQGQVLATLCGGTWVHRAGI